MSFCRSIAGSLVLIAWSTLFRPEVVLAQLDETQEPPLDVQLNVEGQLLDVRFDKPTDIRIDGKTVPVTLTQSDERVLNLQHLSFQYPAYFKFEVSLQDETDEPVSWDLDGEDISVMVFRASINQLRYEDDEHPLVGWMSKIFGDALVKGETLTISTRAATLQGIRYSARVSSGTIDMSVPLDVYEVPGNFGVYRYYLLLYAWDGENPKEEVLVKNLLDESFAIREEPLSQEWRANYESQESEN